MKRAFTLIELIVVIGIIGVLAGILFASFGGGTSTARATKCLSNMRTLAQAAIGMATRSSSTTGYFPLAGSRAALDNDSDVYCVEELGWISWLSKNDEYGMRGNKNHPKAFVAVDNASAYSSQTENDDQTFAITNGRLWRAVNGNRQVYVCPDHVLAVQKAKVNVNWSYVMSAYFGYDWSDGSKAVCLQGSSSGRVSLNSGRLDRTLLFAELPFNDHEFGGKAIKTDFSTSSGTAVDCVLQYKGGSVDGEKFENNWSGTAESIAFNHRYGKRWFAHVAFADGHTEKLEQPMSGGGLTKVQLTALLCGDDGRGGGKDISFNGKSYSKLKN